MGKRVGMRVVNGTAGHNSMRDVAWTRCLVTKGY